MPTSRYRDLPRRAHRRARRIIPSARRVALRTLRIILAVGAALAVLVGVVEAVLGVIDPRLAAYLFMLLAYAVIWLTTVLPIEVFRWFVGSIGGLIALFLLTAAVFWLWRRRRHRSFSMAGRRRRLLRTGTAPHVLEDAVRAEWAAHAGVQPEGTLGNDLRYTDPQWGIEVYLERKLRAPEQKADAIMKQNTSTTTVSAPPPSTLQVVGARVRAPLPVPVDGLIIRPVTSGQEVDGHERIELENRHLSHEVDVTLETTHPPEVGFMLFPPTLQDALARHFADYAAVDISAVRARSGRLEATIDVGGDAALEAAALAVQIIRDMLIAWSYEDEPDARVPTESA